MSYSVNFETTVLEALANLDDFKGTVSAALKKIDERFDKVDERFDKVDERFDKVDERFDKVDERFDEVDQRFEKIESREARRHTYYENRFDALDNKFEAARLHRMNLAGAISNLDAKVEKYHHEMLALTSRFDRLEQKVDNQSS